MKKFFRSFLSGLCFSIFGIGGIITGATLVPVLLIFCSKRTQKRVLSGTVHHLWRAFVWLMCFLKLIDIKIKNEQFLHDLHGNIVIANHPSLIDVVILVSKIPRSICVVKDSLFKNMFIKSLIRRVYLSNSASPDDFIKEATEDLDNGYNIIIFPEGTRTQKHKPIHMHRGFAYLQMHSGHDILPIYIENKPHILGKNTPWYDVGDKTSVYTLKILPKIVFNTRNKKTDRKNAVLITEKAKKSLFLA